MEVLEESSVATSLATVVTCVEVYTNEDYTKICLTSPEPFVIISL